MTHGFYRASGNALRREDHQGAGFEFSLFVSILVGCDLTVGEERDIRVARLFNALLPYKRPVGNLYFELAAHILFECLGVLVEVELAVFPLEIFDALGHIRADGGGGEVVHPLLEHQSGMLRVLQSAAGQNNAEYLICRFPGNGYRPCGLDANRLRHGLDSAGGERMACVAKVALVCGRPAAGL